MSRVASWFPRGVWTTRPDEEKLKKRQLQLQIQKDPILKNFQKRLEFESKVEADKKAGKITPYDEEQGAARNYNFSPNKEEALPLNYDQLVKSGRWTEKPSVEPSVEKQPESEAGGKYNADRLEKLIESGERMKDGGSTVFTIDPDTKKPLGVITNAQRDAFDKKWGLGEQLTQEVKNSQTNTNDAMKATTSEKKYIDPPDLQVVSPEHRAQAIESLKDPKLQERFQQSNTASGGGNLQANMAQLGKGLGLVSSALKVADMFTGGQDKIINAQNRAQQSPKSMASSGLAGSSINDLDQWWMS